MADLSEFSHKLKLYLADVVRFARHQHFYDPNLLSDSSCLTLVGQQGIGKTQFLDFLVPEPLKRFVIRDFSFNDEERLVALGQNLFVHIDESYAFTNLKKDQLLDELFNGGFVTYQALYEKSERKHPRRASFMASVNYLEDATPWYLDVVQVAGFRHDHGGDSGYAQQVDINSVWAQAIHLSAYSN